MKNKKARSSLLLVNAFMHGDALLCGRPRATPILARNNYELRITNYFDQPFGQGRRFEVMYYINAIHDLRSDDWSLQALRKS